MGLDAARLNGSRNPPISHDISYPDFDDSSPHHSHIATSIQDYTYPIPYLGAMRTVYKTARTMRTIRSGGLVDDGVLAPPLLSTLNSPTPLLGRS